MITFFKQCQRWFYGFLILSTILGLNLNGAKIVVSPAFSDDEEVVRWGQLPPESHGLTIDLSQPFFTLTYGGSESPWGIEEQRYKTFAEALGPMVGMADLQAPGILVFLFDDGKPFFGVFFTPNSSDPKAEIGYYTIRYLHPEGNDIFVDIKLHPHLLFEDALLMAGSVLEESRKSYEEPAYLSEILDGFVDNVLPKVAANNVLLNQAQLVVIFHLIKTLRKVAQVFKKFHSPSVENILKMATELANIMDITKVVTADDSQRITNDMSSKFGHIQTEKVAKLFASFIGSLRKISIASTFSAGSRTAALKAFLGTAEPNALKDLLPWIDYLMRFGRAYVTSLYLTTKFEAGGYDKAQSPFSR